MMRSEMGFVASGLTAGSALKSPARIRSRSRGTVFAVDTLPEKGSAQVPYKIAILKGDGAGPQLASMTEQVLRAVEQYTDLHFDLQTLEFGQDSLEKSGSVLPKETVEACKSADAVIRGPQGKSREDQEGHKQLLDQLQLYAQLRPVQSFPEITSASSLKEEHADGMDVMIVREVAGGALVPKLDKSPSSYKADVGETRFSYTGLQVEKISEIALQVAEARNGTVVNVDKAYAIRVSAFWRKNLHRYFAERTQGRSDILLTDMFIDDFCREVILNPKQFDVIVTSNLFGDIIAEVVAGIIGPLRLSPSTWISEDGLHVCGPADIHNSSAYSESEKDMIVNPIAMFRSISMLLRYALDEPAAADLVQKALRRTLEEYVTPDMPNAGKKTVDAATFTSTIEQSLQYMHQFEMVCDPTECGE